VGIDGARKKSDEKGITAQYSVVAATEGEDGKGEQRVLLSQELGGASVEGNGGGGEPKCSTNLVDRGAVGELANHEEHECQIEEAEESSHGEVHPQRSQEEDERKNEPGSQKDSDGAFELSRSLSVRLCDTEGREEQGSKCQPETTEGGESTCAECISSGELPHSSKDLAEATDEASHAEDDVGNGDTASPNVVQGEDEGAATKGEEAERTGVSDDPQLGGGVVEVGVSGKGGGSVSTAAVVVFVAHVV